MRHPLPYAFARTHQLLLEDDGRGLTLWHHEQPHAGAWSEVLRVHAVDHFQQLDSQSLAQRISASYAGAESSAAMVMSEVEGEADLARMMQELPAVEDLLEASADAPIIRMLKCFADASCPRRRQRYSYRAVRRSSPYSIPNRRSPDRT